MNTSSESCIHNLSIDVWVCYDRTIFGWYTTIWKSGIWGCKKITFKVVQIKFLAMHITNQNEFLYIYGKKFTKYFHGTWSLLNILMIFGIKEQSNILTHTMYFGHTTYFWLQIYPSDLRLVLWSRITSVYLWEREFIYKNR